MKLHLPKLLRLALMPSLLSVTLLSAWAEDEMIQSEDMNSEYGVELALADSDYTTVNGKKVLNIGMGSGTMYTGQDLIVGNLVNSDGTVVTPGYCDMVGAVKDGVFVDYDTINNDAKNKYTKNLKIGNLLNGNNLTIYGEGRVVLGGQYDWDLGFLGSGSNYQTLTANKVIVDGNEGVTNLQASNAHLNTLEIHGGRVELHAGGNFRSGNKVSGGNAKRTEISDKIIMKGGSLLVGSEGTVMGENHYLTKLTGSIEQSGNSSIKVAGWSLATAGLKIVQAEGALEFRDRLDITGTNKPISIWQGYEYDASGNLQEVANPAITTEGEPIASKITFGDLGKGTYEINQANNGTIQINKVQSGASLNINQTGTGSIVLGSGFDADAVTVSKSTGTLEFKGNVKLDSLTKDGGAIKVAAGSTMETGSLSWNLEEKQTKDASIQASNVSLTNGSLATKGDTVTNSGNLTADKIVLNSGVFVNEGSINAPNVFADAARIMLAGSDIDYTVVINGGEFQNYGSCNDSVLVDGGTLTLKDAVITGDVMVNSGTVNVLSDSTISSLTLNAESVFNVVEGAVVTLTEADGLIIENGATIVVTVSADVLENLVEREFTLFSDNVSGLTNANVVFTDGDAETEDKMANIVLGSTSGSIKVEGVVSVPEPTTATLSLLALAGLCARRRRR